MNLYVLKLKTLVKCFVGIAAVLFIVFLNYNSSQSVFMEDSVDKLPIYSVSVKDKVCAISFDAAWGAEDTQTLIKILKENNVKATFFVVGDWVDKYPAEVKMLHDAGHDIMNHSDTHKYMTKIDNNQFISEIDNCTEKIEKITGKKVNLFRAPYGDYNAAVIKRLNSMGYYTIQWDVDSLDWKDLSANEIYRRVVSKTRPGSIILFHNAAKHTPQALPDIIKKLKNDGYEFVKINDLIYKNNYYIDNTGKQHKIK